MFENSFIIFYMTSRKEKHRYTMNN